MEELLADHAAALLAALVHGVLHQVVRHVVVAAVDESDHQVARHAAEGLGLGVGQGQQLADVLLVPALAHHEHQLQEVSIVEADPLGLALGHDLLDPLPVALLGVSAGEGEEGLLGGREAPLLHHLEHAVGPGHVARLAVAQDQGVEDVLVDLDALTLHHLQHLARPLDVSVLAVAGDEALEGLLVRVGAVAAHVLKHLVRGELVPVLEVNPEQHVVDTTNITRDNYTPEQGVVVDGGEGDLLVLQQRPHAGHQPGPRSRHLLVQRAAAQPGHGNS